MSIKVYLMAILDTIPIKRKEEEHASSQYQRTKNLHTWH